MLSPSVASLLCPVCRADFKADGAGGALVCQAGHSFDAAKQGYFNFLVGKGTVFEADSADMVAARYEFLSAGHYRPLAEAVAEVSAPALTAPLTASGPAMATVLDAGTGTGHYLRSLLDRVAAEGKAPARRPVAAIGLDISKYALRRAAKLNPEAVNLVGDVWQPLPVADHTVDVVTVVFAPRNAAEFARVLRPGGSLVIVTPRPGHLAEVASRTGMLGIEPAKDERLSASLAGRFSLLDARDLDLDLALSPADVASLALMGPAGHHLDRSALDSFAGALAPLTAVSARFRISVFQPRS